MGVILLGLTLVVGCLLFGQFLAAFAVFAATVWYWSGQ